MVRDPQFLYIFLVFLRSLILGFLVPSHTLWMSVACLRAHTSSHDPPQYSVLWSVLSISPLSFLYPLLFPVSAYFSWIRLEAALILLPVFSNRFFTLTLSWNLLASHPRYKCPWPLSGCFVVHLDIERWLCCSIEHHVLATCSLPWNRTFIRSSHDFDVCPAHPGISLRPPIRPHSKFTSRRYEWK